MAVIKYDLQGYRVVGDFSSQVTKYPGMKVAAAPEILPPDTDESELQIIVEDRRLSESETEDPIIKQQSFHYYRENTQYLFFAWRDKATGRLYNENEEFKDMSGDTTLCLEVTELNLPIVVNTNWIKKPGYELSHFEIHKDNTFRAVQLDFDASWSDGIPADGQPHLLSGKLPDQFKIVATEYTDVTSPDGYRIVPGVGRFYNQELTHYTYDSDGTPVLLATGGLFSTPNRACRIKYYGTGYFDEECCDIWKYAYPDNKGYVKYYTEQMVNADQDLEVGNWMVVFNNMRLVGYWSPTSDAQVLDSQKGYQDYFVHINCDSEWIRHTPQIYINGKWEGISIPRTPNEEL